MKIRVQRRDGRIETITLVPPVSEIRDGSNLSSFKCGEGVEHFFTPEGHYDGWGRFTEGIPMNEAEEIIERIERDRTIDPK